MDEDLVLPEFNLPHDSDFVAPWNPAASSPSTSLLIRHDPTATSSSASATSTAQLMSPPPPPDAFLQLLCRRSGLMPAQQLDAANSHPPSQQSGTANPLLPRQDQQAGSEGSISHKRARARARARPSLALPFSSALKVRKEKLGDRITTLQQLVSPFGKTDTASVLMEAIGYIKFMQQQVQVLIMPYTTSFERCNTNEEMDLRSRGLCLVPVSSQFINDKDDIMDCWTHPLERDLGDLCHKYRPVI